jgi:hypothetical protein
LTVALIAALGGTSYAALTVPRNSVGTRQLKNKAVTLAKIAPGAQKSLTRIGSQGNSGPKVHRAPKAPKAPRGRKARPANDANHAISADNATNANHALSADQANVAGALTDMSYVRSREFVVPHGGSVAGGDAISPAGGIVVGDKVHTQFGSESVTSIEPMTHVGGTEPV